MDCYRLHEIKYIGNAVKLIHGKAALNVLGKMMSEWSLSAAARSSSLLGSDVSLTRARCLPLFMLLGADKKNAKNASHASHSGC